MPKRIERRAVAASLCAFAVVLCLGTTTGVRAQEAQGQPSAELLEFLGSFETADGEWLDPGLFDEARTMDGNEEPAGATAEPAAAITDDANGRAHETAREEP